MLTIRGIGKKNFRYEKNWFPKLGLRHLVYRMNGFQIPEDDPPPRMPSNPTKEDLEEFKRKAFQWASKDGPEGEMMRIWGKMEDAGEVRPFKHANLWRIEMQPIRRRVENTEGVIRK